MNILCSRKILIEFRRECRKRFPNEHFAAIYGLRSDEGNFVITRIAPIEHKADPSGIKVNGACIVKSKRAALRQGEDWLGTCHSHCDSIKDPCCWHLSKADIKSALQWGEAICGLVFVDMGGRRSAVHWYVPAPIPSVIYS